VQQVKLANCYPTEFDETTDAAHVSQLSLIVCYCCNGVRREDFVGFLDLHSSNYQLKTADTIVEPKVKGDTIASSVLRMLDSLDLCVNKCVGIGTDGCSILTSQRCGEVTELLRKAVNAIHCPCFNHALNLSLSNCSDAKAIRNCSGVTAEVV